MDDFAAGAEYDNCSVTINYDLTAPVKLMNFSLAKWSYNSEQLKPIRLAEGQEIEVQTQFLGVKWNTC
jgi:hypothetical protein